MNRLVLFLPFLAISACSWFDNVSSGDKKEQSSDTYYQLGVRYMEMNRIDEARANLDRAIDADSGNADARNALGVLFERLNQFDDAEEQYVKALDLKPGDFGIQNNLGRFWCEHAKINDGMAMLTSAADSPLNDRSWMALTNGGRCQLMNGNASEAETYFRRALEANKEYAPALAAMQKISYQKGDLWAAKGFLARYLSVAPHTSETLYIAYYTERTLGNTDAAEEYRQVLQSRFPRSDEAKKIMSVGK